MANRQDSALVPSNVVSTHPSDKNVIDTRPSVPDGSGRRKIRAQIWSISLALIAYRSDECLDRDESAAKEKYDNVHHRL